MTPDSIRSRLHTRVVGRRVHCVELCESTNDLAWKAALDGEPDGTVFFAEEQTKGRGRFGRVWSAPRGKGLLCSVLLRPELDVDRVPLVTAMAALAAADTVGEEAKIRFPNDVVLPEGKVAGVLVEARFIGARPDVFIAGIGLNVNAHPPDVGAASLGPEVSRIATARHLLEALDGWYARLDGHLREFRKAWRDRSSIVRRRVRVRHHDKWVSGTVDDVDPLDGVTLRLDSGHLRTFRGEHVEKLQVQNPEA